MNTEAILILAENHGLNLEPSSLNVIEMGLDFRVVIARSSTAEDWVLRIPRYPAVMDRAVAEGHVLALVADRLSAEVPNWRVHTEQLIAYPLLAGEPGLELDATGAPVWNVDVSSPAYAESLGALLAELHAVPPAEAATTGIPIRDAAQAREVWRRDIETVAVEFTVAGHLLERWRAWLAEDSYWPTHTVLTHGEIYAGHTLVRDGRVSGVLDWTTASVGDPGRDLMFQQMSASAEGFERMLESYERGGGVTWPRLREHCAELASANPVGYGIYALETGEQTHRAAAAQALNPGA
ncbi:macrolide 2'-phosphotransferase [Corynebacterium halotolerans]|uniref:macrolide 2'-phosphotransferase n=1 Tax=Corynebacterium halotolerans TaxID=225326 RepID=UPI003CF87941